MNYGDFNYCFEVEPAKAGHSAICRSNQCPNHVNVSKYYPEVETCYDCFQRGKRLSPNGPCYGYRPVVDGVAQDYKWETFNEFWERIQNFGSGLKYLNLVPANCGYSCIGLFCKNCMEWVLTAQAAYAYQLTIVPIYDTLGAESVEFIVSQTKMNCAVCSQLEMMKLLALAETIKTLKAIIQIEEVSDNDRKVANEAGVTMYSVAEIEKIGSEHRSAPIPPNPDDVHTICYTSGTTGKAKGALYTHRQSMSCLAGCLFTGINTNPGDRYLSYLPLAHVLERLLEDAITINGAAIGFYQGSTKLILDDIKALRPTLFTSVPRLLNKIYDAINAKVKAKGGIAEYLFYKGIAAKKYQMTHGGSNYHWFYDNFVFNTVKATIGLDADRLTISGSAPLSTEVLDFFRCVLGGIVVEGYGSTETAAATGLQVGWDYSCGNIGGPLACCDFKVVDVPEMNYFTTDRYHNDIPCLARGELCIRGYNVSPGYFENPEETAAAFDSEGFFHTGDVAVILPNYSFKIVDRKKNFFKLSQGEYVAAEKLEIIYGNSPFISQIFVYGNSLENYLVAIIVADEGYTKKWARDNNHSDLTFKQITDLDEYKNALKQDLARLFTENGLRGFERIVKFEIETEAWSSDNGLLTPTFKLKRNAVKAKYEQELNTLYTKN
ncbi:hypothetical protein WA158_001188 [Blastocystis sp. Blastoise]